MVNSRKFSHKENADRVRQRRNFLETLGGQSKSPALSSAKKAVLEAYRSRSSGAKWDMIQAWASGKNDWILAYAERLQAEPPSPIFKKGDFVNLKELTPELENRLSEEDLVTIGQESRTTTFRVLRKIKDFYQIAPSWADTPLACLVHEDFLKVVDA